TTGAFAFSFDLGGTATRVTDYVVSGGGVTFDVNGVGTATIPNGAQFVDLTFLAATRVAAAGTQSIEFVLRPDAARYGVGGPTNGGATITVRDNKPTVTIAATIPNASEAQGNNIATNGRFTVTRAGAPLTAALTVTYAITGTATGGTDYTTLTGTVTIPAGAASANIDVAPLFDGTFEANETVIATLTAAGGATYNLGAVAQRTATVTIADRTPTVTIAAIRPVGAETAPGAVAQTGAYRITRTGGDTSRPLTVNYSVSGTATSALDYAALSGTATIPAGQTFVDVVVTPVTDIVTETPETVIATITPAATYSLGAEPTRASTVTINNANLTDLRVVGSSLPTVTNISYDQAGVTVPAIVTINNPGSALTGAVTVSVFWLTGSAIPVTAQPVLSQTLNGLANGDTTVDLTFALSTVGQVLPGVYNVGFRVTTPTGFVDINPSDNANVLNAGANGTTPAFYNVFAGSVATGSTISVAATDATAAEVPAGLPANGGTFTITRTGGNLNQRLVVPFTFASPASLPAATLNTDFLAFTRFVIFEAGQTSATVNIDVIDDTLAPVAEPREALRLVLTNSNAYAIGGSGDAEITIDDNEAVSVGVAGTQNGSNDGTNVVNGNFRFSRVGDTANAVTINYTVTGDAVAGTDYTALPGSVTIPAGANFVDVPINVLANNIAGGNLGLILTIDPSVNYAISTAFAPIAINDIRPTEIAAEAPTGDPFPPSNAGDPLTVALNFLNNTSFLTRFSWTLFASTNNTLEVGTDVLLSSGTQLNTPAGAGSINSTFNLPTLASGTYFLIFSITPRGAETNTANNVASTATAVLTIV
nr:hypothetical protein [Phycisphaerales bacterium]